MEAIRSNPNVCFEVDGSLSDAPLAKSMLIMGWAEIIEQRVRICLITPYKVTG